MGALEVELIRWMFVFWLGAVGALALWLRRCPGTGIIGALTFLGSSFSGARMGKINTGKVVLGGLVAGVVLNLLDAVNNGLIMKADFAANSTRLGLDPSGMEAPAVIATWVVLDFLIGILLVWTYAAVRPRFGPGPKTAIIASLVPFLSVSFVLYGLTAMGLLDSVLYWKATVLQAIILGVAAVAGAALYKEE